MPGSSRSPSPSTATSSPCKQRLHGKTDPALALGLTNPSYYSSAGEARKRVAGRCIWPCVASARPDHPDLALSLNNLGSLLRTWGSMRRRRRSTADALAMRAPLRQADHRDPPQSGQPGRPLPAQGKYAGRDFLPRRPGPGSSSTRPGRPPRPGRPASGLLQIAGCATPRPNCSTATPWP